MTPAHGRAPMPPGADASRPDAALVVDHLTKRFGQRAAFEDVSFEVGYGEVFGFLGPNGVGKTTMVRTLGTLLAPTSGSAVVAGIPLDLEAGSHIRARISIMPESPGLYLRLTVAENLECFAGLYELTDIRERSPVHFSTIQRSSSSTSPRPGSIPWRRATFTSSSRHFATRGSRSS